MFFNKSEYVQITVEKHRRKSLAVSGAVKVLSGRLSDMSGKYE